MGRAEKGLGQPLRIADFVVVVQWGFLCEEYKFIFLWLIHQWSNCSWSPYKNKMKKNARTFKATGIEFGETTVKHFTQGRGDGRSAN